MGKALRWLRAIVGGLLLLAIVLFASARLMGPSKEQQAALALLDDTQPRHGRNGFAALWLMAYDVPEAERERVLAEDVRRYNSAPVPNYTRIESSAAGRYAAQDKVQGELYCKWRERDCLTKIRANPDAYSKLLAKDTALVARADDVSKYGHVRSAFAERLDMPFPPYQMLAYPLTRHAHAFASGEIDAALDGVCRGVSASRMLIRDGGNLIGAMVGAVMLEGNAALLADMLSELPADRQLPISCATAFAPAEADAFSACPAMRSEARLMFAAARQSAMQPNADNRFPKLPSALLHNTDKTIALMAPPLAWYCGEQARTAIAADLPVQPPSVAPKRAFECIDNVIGCILSAIQNPSYHEYQHRLQDAGIRLKMAGTLLWLRDRTASQSIAERLAQRPVTLRSPHRELLLSQDGTSLSVALFDHRHGKTWSLPLPASRQPQL